ncbi:MAG TPA: AIR synthase-related protein, partial [bacterium]|nr:AIR synthase-related protein [bacterium]
ADSINFGVNQLEPGDKILINGNIGEHAAAIITARQNFDIRFKTQSDCACVYSLIEKLTDELENIKIMRDPTRGGLATTLNEFVMEQRVGIKIDEEKIPIREQIKGFCEPLGFDPLYLANEGKFITIVKDNEAQKALSIMKSHDLGQNATILGEVTSQNPGRVILKTTIGSTRVLDMMSGEMLPRIC